MLPFTPSSICTNHTGLCLIFSLFITFLCQAGWWRIHSFLQVFAQICLPTTTWTSWFKAVAASLLPIHLPPGLQSLLFSTFLLSTSPFNKWHDVLTYHIVFSVCLSPSGRRDAPQARTSFCSGLGPGRWEEHPAYSPLTFVGWMKASPPAAPGGTATQCELTT